MAKQRNSAFSSPKPPSKKEVNEAAKAMEIKALTGKAGAGKTKRKHLYVDEARHQAAKVAASRQGLTLQEYIEGLIDNDRK